MIPYFPKQIANKAIVIYLVALGFVSVMFLQYAMQLEYIIMGVVWVAGFFLLTSYCSRKWWRITSGRFVTNVAMAAFGVRFIWVVFSFFYYYAKTGQPFEFEAADSLGYWDDAIWLSRERFSVIIDYLFINRPTVSDSGYVFYLSLLCKIIGPHIFLTRIVKAGLGAFTVILVYHLAKRNFGEEVGRLAAIMACFMPNLIIYSGLQLKENEMLFLMMAFLERVDYLLRSKQYNAITIIVPSLLLLSLFTFRTVLGIAGAFALVTALLVTRTSVIGQNKRVLLISWMVVLVMVLVGGAIVGESEGLWKDRFSNQESKRMEQTLRGGQWAKYATGTVMAPMIFVLPFPTMVDVDKQYNQQIMSGGNYVRNFMGGFVLLALVSALLVKKNWRDMSLLGSCLVAYLGIISMSGFSNSERFLLPGLPGLLIAAAYGMSLLNARNYRFVKLWYLIVPLMSIGWAVFKLGSRGIL